MAHVVDEAARDYIAAISAEQRPLFDRVHALILAVHPDVTVLLSYKIPTYAVGTRRVYVGVWKHGLSFYGWSSGRDGGFAASHPDLVTNKGTIKLGPDEAAAVSDEELSALFSAALAD